MSGKVTQNLSRSSGLLKAPESAGAIDWKTGDVKTANFTAVAGEGYFVNTTSSAFTATLPAGTAGDMISFVDYASTFDSNTLSITPDGSEKINGTAAVTLVSTEGLSLTLIYVDGTRGWKSITGSDDDTTGLTPTYIVATGGTITASGDYKIHAFTSNANFTVCSVGNASGGPNKVDYMVIAGGGGSGGSARWGLSNQQRFERILVWSPKPTNGSGAGVGLTELELNYTEDPGRS